MAGGYRKILTFSAVFLGFWLFSAYLFPLISPFLLGLLLALAARPLEEFFRKRLCLPSAVSSGIAVFAVLTLLGLLLAMLGALLLRLLENLTDLLPGVTAAFTAGSQTLYAWLLGLTRRFPASLRPGLEKLVTGLFSRGSALLDGLIRSALSLAAGLLRALPDSALGLATGVISAFLICPRLPRLQAWLSRSAGSGIQTLLALLTRIKTALLGWLKAQLSLMAITFCLLTPGFFLLRISHAPLWAALTALVDAFPILGTGTVLLPWSAVCFLRGSTAQGIGLLGLYAAVLLIRSLLEPRLLGRQLGLDPLLTLIALYAGYKLWGFAGMILAPALAVAARQLPEDRKKAG